MTPAREIERAEVKLENAEDTGCSLKFDFQHLLRAQMPTLEYRRTLLFETKAVYIYFISSAIEVLSAIAVIFVYTEKAQIWVADSALAAIEGVLVLYWDSFETEKSKKVYRECTEHFKKYSDANYFLHFGSSKNKKLEDKGAEASKQLQTGSGILNELQMLIPVAVALLLNALIMYWVYFYVMLCKEQCAPGDAACYSMILLPRLVNFAAAIYFFASYKSIYLRKHWHEMKASPSARGSTDRELTDTHRINSEALELLQKDLDIKRTCAAVSVNQQVQRRAK